MNHGTIAAGGRHYLWRWAATFAMLLALVGGSFAQVSAATADVPAPPGPTAPHAKHPATTGQRAPAASGASAAAVTPGNLYGWGYNSDGELGDGTEQYNDRYVPVQTVSISNVVNVSGGYDHTLAATADGSAYAWGYNYDSELGIGDGGYYYYDYPMQVVAPGTCPSASPSAGNLIPGACGYLKGVVAVAAGSEHSLALTSDGKVYAWGYGGYGQLGIDTSSTSYFDRPQQVLGPGGSGFLTGIVAIAAGEYSSYALKSDGTVFSWGYNSSGQLGDGTNDDSNYPVQVVADGPCPSASPSPSPSPNPAACGFLTNVAAISAGEDGYTALALKNDGTVFAWGYGGDGELGNATTNSSNRPVQVRGLNGNGFLTGVATISNGSYHSLARLTDGTVLAWGENSDGELGNGTTNNSNRVASQ